MAATTTEILADDGAYIASHYLSLLIVDDERWIRDSCKEGAENMELKLLLERVTEHLRFSLENRITREHLKNNPGYAGMVGRSQEMEKLYRIVAKVASSRHPVLIQGESGAGKEMVARAIHFTGPFR